MSQINPIGGSIVQASNVQKLESGDQSRHLRHIADLSRNVAAREDEVDIQLENPDELHEPVDRDPQKQRPRNPKKHHREEQDEEPGEQRLDLTA